MHIKLILLICIQNIYKTSKYESQIHFYNGSPKDINNHNNDIENQ
jgi:hypothetical protein